VTDPTAVMYHAQMYLGQQRWGRCAASCEAFSPGLDKRLTYQPIKLEPFFTSRLAVFHLIIDHRFVKISRGLLLFDAMLLATSHYPMEHEFYGLLVFFSHGLVLSFFGLELLLRCAPPAAPVPSLLRTPARPTGRAAFGDIGTIASELE
jgi:hypothetical protein